MGWISQISNKAELPETNFWVTTQERKALFYSESSSLVKRDIVISFPSLELAQFFIEKWEGYTMTDYKQACKAGNYSMWVILKTPNGYYADEIRIKE
jgi:hypothetical protein